MAKPNIDLKDYESGFARFDSLMPYKVKDILLVSSLYDSFILEEDGHIAQMIFNEYVELNLSFAPQIKRVSSGEEALRLLKQHKFDLVMVFRKLGDTDVIAFGKQAKEIIPNIPIVLLAFHPRELSVMDHPNFPAAFDNAFLWNGEGNILLAITKYIEDRLNVDFDTRLVGVRVIILIEDSIKFYSAYLPLLYSVIMRQTQELMTDGLNLSHRLLRMRARPKIIMAKTYEEGLELYEKYKKYLLGIISDIKFSKGGKIDDLAGLKLARKIKNHVPDLPILLQSSNFEHAEEAEKCNVAFLHKKTPALLAELKTFIRRNFGFGDFVFRLPDGSVAARAGDFHSMEKCLAKVPEESLIFHANRNHFSNWLMARTEFDLANRLRPRKVSEFKDAEAVRSYLISTFRGFRHEKQLGIVSDFSRRQFDLQSDFVRIGEGSLGGKGRGLAFISRLLRRYNVYDCFDGVNINVPPAAILGTSIFDKFLEDNNLLEYALGEHTDEEIYRAFLKARLPKDTRADLNYFLDIIKYPLAVRSSSLLEDSHYQPFAGIFDTHMLPNVHPNKKERLKRLETAVKLIYASIFSRKSKKYIEATGNRVEEEKMAVILQRVVGRRRKDTFYPVLSGIARSCNFYPIGNIKPQEGVVYAALGLGKTIVEGGNCLYFSPSNPQHLPQFSSAKDFLNNSQHNFFAIDMSDTCVQPEPGAEAGLVKLRIDQAMDHGSLQYVGSTYSPDNDRVTEGVNRPGIKLVTFAPILKSRIFPLDEIIRFLLQLGSSGMNIPVEIEFAAELSADPKKPHNFGFLQIRPMATEMVLEGVTLDKFDNDEIICKSNQALSNGRNNTIKDIIYVNPDNFDRADMPAMAAEVGRFNDLFKEENRPYLLIGPGRWGTADRWLGIPTTWDQISSAQIIIEAAYGDFAVTPSFGTHFFQNLIAFQIGYLTINSFNDENFINWEWLKSQKVADETEHIRHIRLKKPVESLIDGHDGRAVILKPKI